MFVDVCGCVCVGGAVRVSARLCVCVRLCLAAGHHARSSLYKGELGGLCSE